MFQAAFHCAVAPVTVRAASIHSTAWRLHCKQHVPIFRSSTASCRRVGVLLGLLAAIGCKPSADTRAPRSSPASSATTQQAAPEARLRAPTDADIPNDALGTVVRRGLQLVSRTSETLPEHSASGLHCTSCHLEGGTKAFASPWLGILAKFPEYRARSGKLDSIEDRINDCFERSLNGKALDAASADMAAIVAYMRFISRDVPAGETPGRGFLRLPPSAALDRTQGELLYKQHCSSCHGADASGLAPGGVYVFPALAGPRSFNIGAGMARLNNAAAFIRANMPLAQGGTLTEQQAYDVADYVIHLDRPEFPGSVRDWPKGDKPSDARY